MLSYRKRSAVAWGDDIEKLPVGIILNFTIEVWRNGSALALGARCCRFESCHFDQKTKGEHSLPLGFFVETLHGLEARKA